jgi:glycosyltransferase involved in cell wall biosynthesis
MKSNKAPKISVIIPVYNGEKTIRETIASVLKQTESDFELIVINDGSQDSTLDVIASIQDARLQVFSYPNAGVAASRNRGLCQASGDFISFLDADDLWTPDKLEAQLKALEENPQAAVAYSWTDHIDESSQFLSPGPHVALSGDIYARLLLGNFLSNGSNVLIRAHALTAVGGFEESLAPAEDWDMWLRLAARYQFVAVPFTHILYRISTASASCNLSKMEVASLRVIERAYTQAPASLQHLKKETFAFFYNYLISKALEGPPGRQKALKAAKLLWHYITNDCSRLRLFRFKLSLLSKVVAAFLPPLHQELKIRLIEVR